jgi:RNA polymerase sigma factor (sigma-70 family)
VLKAKSGDKSSLENILNKFTPVIIKYSSSIYLSSYSREDLIQEGYLYLVNIIKKYNPKRNRFVVYASIALKNNYNYLIRQKARYNMELSYNNSIGQSDVNFECFLMDNLNIEEKFIQSKNKKALYSALKNLDEKELDILIHYYFKELSIKSYAVKNNMLYHSCVNLKKTALSHLKEIIKA